MNKTWNVTLSILLVFSVLLNIFTLGVLHKETTSSHEEWLDELDQQYAENHFCFERVNDTNHYIADFKFVIPDSSTVGELCDILRSQINDYIISL